MALADGVTEEYATAINEAIETANRAEVTTDRLWTELNDLTDKYNDLVTACIEKNERLEGLFAWLKSICTVHGLHAHAAELTTLEEFFGCDVLEIPHFGRFIEGWCLKTLSQDADSPVQD